LAGAQPKEVFLQVLEKALEEPQEQPAADQCSTDACDVPAKPE